MQNNYKGKIVIVGGGIVGLCSAYYLAKQGFSITIIDKGDLKNNCSNGNAGMIVPSHFTPLAAPGIVAQGLRWLLNSKSPFYIRPSLSTSLISWGLKFLRHANQKHVETAAPFICELNNYSSELYKQLSLELNNGFELTHRGILMLYKKEKTAEEEIHLAEKAAEFGLAAEVLNKEQVQAIEPNVELNVLGAVHYRCDSHLYPTAIIHQLIQKLDASGVVFEKNTEVKKVETENGKIIALISEDKKFSADYFVFAAGAELESLAQKAKLKIPVLPGKGYSFMTDAFQQQLLHPAILLEDRVAITPMNGQVRVGGTMELGAIHHNININRLKGIVEAVPKYYPKQQISTPNIKEVWYGFRPCSPDGLPYLGKTTTFSNLIVAGGLGMMGMSLGPAAGKVVAGIIGEEKLPVSIHPFSVERFN